MLPMNLSIITRSAHNMIHGLPARSLLRILIVRNIELATQMLGTNKRQHDNVGIHAPHEDADDLAVVVATGAALGLAEGETLADARLDGGGSRRNKVTELVGCSDDESAEGAGGQFHEMDGDDTPCALDAELLEECGGHDGLGTDECVRVE